MREKGLECSKMLINMRENGFVLEVYEGKRAR
jgi:hypothetical protein